jgi:pSer/pThr/pTyr-binding forkhead associated (FHA) protein
MLLAGWAVVELMIPPFARGQADEDATVVAGRPRPGKIEAVAWLAITKTPSVRKGRIFTLEKVRTGIGRVQDVDIILDDPEVGRVHAAVRYEGPADSSGVFVLYDLASANGAFLNGEPVTAPTELKDGDWVALG